MKKASKGIDKKELYSELDSKLEYGGARRLSKFEIELLDRIDQMCDFQVKTQTSLHSKIKVNERLQEKLDKTNQAISEYCTENTVKKIELATGWQFGSEETEKINSSLSDKELIEFVKMKSDIKKAISEKIMERSSKQEIKKNQDQNERE